MGDGTLTGSLTSAGLVRPGTAGGLMLLVIMASFMSPAALMPVHTLIQFGSGAGRAISMWQHVLKGTVVPFTLGCLAGAAAGAPLLITLPQAIVLGVLGIFINRKNIIVILMSVELILLSVNINLVAFSTQLNDITGQVFALFVLTVAAAESAIGLAILVVFFRNRGSIAVEDVSMMKG